MRPVFVLKMHKLCWQDSFIPTRIGPRPYADMSSYAILNGLARTYVLTSSWKHNSFK